MMTPTRGYSPLPSQRAARGRRSLVGSLLLGLGVLFACLFSGMAAAVLPWWLIMIALGLPLLILAGHVWPFLGLLGVVVLSSGMVPSSVLPQLPLGPGKILGADLALMMMLGLAVLKCGGRGLEALRSAKPFLQPIAVFLLAIPLCSAVGYLLHGTMIKEVLTEARVQIYWMVVFLPIVLITNMRDLNRVMWGIVWIGVVLSVIVVLQFVTGIHLLENARVENLRTMGTNYSDVTRSTAGGAIYLIVLPVFFLVARMLTRSLSPLIVLPLLAVLASGIIVSFGRGIWITTVIGLLAIAWRLGGTKAVQKLLAALVIGVALAVAALSAFKPHMIDAALERFTSTFSEGANKTSLGDRLEENSFAFKKIMSSPVIGIGFGSAYKPRLDAYVDWSQVRYIHNSYIGLWLKVGFMGPILAAWLIYIVFKRGLLVLRRPGLDGRSLSVAIACVAGFFVPVVTSITQPEWLSTTGVSFFALIAGLVAALEFQLRQSDSERAR